MEPQVGGYGYPSYALTQCSAPRHQKWQCALSAWWNFKTRGPRLQRVSDWRNPIKRDINRQPKLDVPWDCQWCTLLQRSRCLGIWVLCLRACYWDTTLHTWTIRPCLNSCQMVCRVQRLCWQMPNHRPEEALDNWLALSTQFLGQCRG